MLFNAVALQCFVFSAKQAIDDTTMEVDVAIECRTKPVNEGDRTQSGMFRRIWTARMKRLLDTIQKNP